MEYTYILAIKNEQNQIVFDNILTMFPAIVQTGRYRENMQKKEPGDIPPSPIDPGLRTGAFYLLIKAESASFSPELLTDVVSPFLFDGPDAAANVLKNFW